MTFPFQTPFFIGLSGPWLLMTYGIYEGFLIWIISLNLLDVLVWSGYGPKALRRKETSGNTLIQLYACLESKCSFGTTQIVHTRSSAT